MSPRDVIFYVLSPKTIRALLLTNGWLWTLGLSMEWMANINTPASMFVRCITTAKHSSLGLFMLENSGKRTDCTAWWIPVWNYVQNVCVCMNICYRCSCPKTLRSCVFHLSLWVPRSNLRPTINSHINNISCHAPLKDKGSKASAPAAYTPAAL